MQDIAKSPLTAASRNDGQNRWLTAAIVSRLFQKFDQENSQSRPVSIVRLIITKTTAAEFRMIMLSKRKALTSKFGFVLIYRHIILISGWRRRVQVEKTMSVGMNGRPSHEVIRKPFVTYLVIDQ